MTDNSGTYDIAALRRLLLGAFDAVGLKRMCQYHSVLHPIVSSFGPNQGLETMVDEVIGYCVRQLVVDDLLLAVKEVNPRRVKLYLQERQAVKSPVTPGCLFLTWDYPVHNADATALGWLTYSLATFARIPADRARVVFMMVGSLELTIKFPEPAAQRLLDAYARGDLEFKDLLQALNITSIRRPPPTQEPVPPGQELRIPPRAPDSAFAVDHFKSLLLESAQREEVDLAGWVEYLTGLGDAYHEIGHYRNAIESYRRARNLANALDNKVAEARALFGLGRSYFAQGEPDRAGQLCQESARIFDSLGLPDGKHVRHYQKHPQTYALAVQPTRSMMTSDEEERRATIRSESIWPGYRLLDQYGIKSRLEQREEEWRKEHDLGWKHDIARRIGPRKIGPADR